jgi:hypothetical protein
MTGPVVWEWNGEKYANFITVTRLWRDARSIGTASQARWIWWWILFRNPAVTHTGSRHCRWFGKAFVTCGFRNNNVPWKLSQVIGRLEIHKIRHVMVTKNLRGLSRLANYAERASERRLSLTLLPTFVDTGSHVVSVTDPYGHILGFIDRSRYFFFQIAPQLYSRGWVDPVPDSLLLRKSDSAGTRTRTSGSVVKNSVH